MNPLKTCLTELYDIRSTGVATPETSSCGGPYFQLDFGGVKFPQQ